MWIRPILPNLDTYRPFQIGACLPTETAVADFLDELKFLVLGYELPDNQLFAIASEWCKLAKNFPKGQAFGIAQIAGGEAGLTETLNALADKNLLVVILSGDANLLGGLFRHEQLHLQKLGLVDSHLDYHWTKSPETPDFLLDVLLAQREKLKTLSLLAYQTYFVDTLLLDMLESQKNRLLRLGNLKAKIEQAEPLLRDLEALSFNLSAIRAGDVGACALAANPNGLWAEEACKLVRYAGISDKLRYLVLTGWQNTAEYPPLFALLAQMVWFAAEGCFQRKADYPLQIETLRAYTVVLPDTETELTFFKSLKSERWWLGLEGWDGISPVEDFLVPCNYEDYEQASKGHLSDWLWNHLS